MQQLTKIALATALAASLAATAADWSRYRGPEGNGISAETGLNTDWAAKAPKVLWEFAATDKGYAGVAVSGGKAVFVDHFDKTDVVRCLNLADGKPLWKYTYDDAVAADYGFTRATPAIVDGKVYVIGRLGFVGCLKLDDGTLIWKKDLVGDFGGKRPGWKYSMSPVVDENRLYVMPGAPGPTIMALDKDTGATLWKGGTDAAGYSTPVVMTLNGVKQVLAFSAGNLTGYEAATGKQLWSTVWKTQYSMNCAMSVAVSANQLFVSSGYGTGSALLEIGKDGAVTTKWANKAIKAWMNSPLLLNGAIYCGGEQRKLICLDPMTGAVKWEQAGFGDTGIIAVSGIFIGIDDKSGDVVAFAQSPDAYKELGRIKPMPGVRDYWAPPIVADGKLIVRSTAKIVCLDLAK